MRGILTILLICMVCGFFLTSQAFAHTPICFCYDNGDETITCEGGFSDGASAAGVVIRVVDDNDEVIAVKNKGRGGEIIYLNGKMDEDSEWTFVKPKKSYKVIFDAGPGHVVEIEGEDIAE